MGDNAPKTLAVYKWITQFKKEWDDVEDKTCSGRPLTEFVRKKIVLLMPGLKRTNN